MSRRPLVSRATRCGLVSCIVVTGASCMDVVSLEPTIGPGEAISAPGLIGDWMEITPEGEQEADTTWVRVTRERDSTRYLVTGIRSRNAEPPEYGRPTVWLRVRPAGERLLAELSPARIDVVVDSMVWRYGGMVQLTHQLVMLKPMGDSIQYWLFDGDSVQSALTDARCPTPGRVVSRSGALVLTGDSRELRTTTDCLIALPRVLGSPGVFHRLQAP